MVELGYRIANCDDFITWATHSFGSDVILFLILCGILFILHLILHVLRLLEQIGQRLLVCISKSCRLIETYLRSRFTSRNSRRRPSSSIDPSSLSQLQQSTLRCFDRPDCPILSPILSRSYSASPIIQPPTDLLRSSPEVCKDGNPTPSIPLAPPNTLPRRNPQRRRNSLL